MNVKECLDKRVLSCGDRIQEEVAALLGKPFTLAEPEFRHAGKEELFTGADGTAILTHAGLEGEAQGDGCILVGIDAAIRLGGARLMLPEPEMEPFLAGQAVSEELQAAYQDIAQAICAAVTAGLAEQHPNTRLACGQQEIVDPTAVAIESDQPIPDTPYYLLTASMQLDGQELGLLRLALPAHPFDPEDGGDAAAEPLDGHATPVPAAAKSDADARDELVDHLLHSGMARIGEEMSALLVSALEIVPEERQTVTRTAFLDQAGGKQIMTRMRIKGDYQGEAYVFVDHSTAIYLGGALIMLPEDELEETVRNEDFHDDAHDAYEEVSDIVASVYSALFEAQEHGGFGLAQSSMEPVVPARIAPDTDDVFPDQMYCLATGRIRHDGRDLGRMQVLIPEDALALGEASLPDKANEPAGEILDAGLAAASDGKAAVAGPGRSQPEERPDIVVFTDDDNEAARIVDILAAMGYLCRVLHFKDQVHSVIHPGVRIVFLVMREASELGFGMAIKISGAGLPVPLVVAAPAWTRTLVLKAVKYGARDILVTPASHADVQEKIEVNLAAHAV